jgi:predicted RNase H-like HicB family nuclease
MSLLKQAKDRLIRLALGSKVVPSGLAELGHYIRVNGSIDFGFEKQEDGSYVAVSKDFRYGSIVTAGKDLRELEDNIKDAILTSFEIPSSYARDADLRRVESDKRGYAFA